MIAETHIINEQRFPGGEVSPAVNGNVGQLARRLRACHEEIEHAILTQAPDITAKESGAGDAESTAGLHAAVKAALDHTLAGIELVQRLVIEISDAHSNDALRAGHTPAQPLAARVRVLLANNLGEQAADAAAAVNLDYPLEREHIAIIAKGPGARTTLLGLARQLDRRLLTVDHDNETVWGWLAGTRQLQIAQLQHALATHPPASDLALAVGEPAHGLSGWRLTHYQAQAALTVAQHHPTQLTRYADVALLAAVLKDQTLTETLTNTYLMPLEDHRGSGPALRQTLRTYLAANQNITSTAAALKVARSTIEHRLQTIETRLNKTLQPHPPELTTALQLDGLRRDCRA